MKKAVVIFTLFLALVACGQGGSLNDDERTTPSMDVQLAEGVTGGMAQDIAPNIPALADLEQMFPRFYNNLGTIIPGGNLNYPLTLPNMNFAALGETLAGTFIPGRAIQQMWGMMMQDEDRPGFFDGQIANVLSPDLLMYDTSGNLILGDEHDGPIIIEADFVRNTVTKTFREGLNIHWHDGVLMTMDDILFMYERLIVSSRLPEGVFITGIGSSENYLELIIGANDFANGEADTITGIHISPDGRSMTIEFTMLPPEMFTAFGGFNGLIGTALPRHHLGFVPPAELVTHPNSRENVIGYGPFRFDSMEINERVTLVANEDYWQGRPHLDSVTYHVLTDEEALERLLAGTIDLLNGIPSAALERVQNTPYLHVMGNVSPSSEMFYFILGSQSFTVAAGELQANWTPRAGNHPILDPAVRRAIAYAIDQVSIEEAFGFGVSVPANSVLSPVSHRDLIPDEPGLAHFDLELANQLLDAAGYTLGGHGFRLDLAGNTFQIDIAMAYSVRNEFIFDKLRENFAAIGLDLRLAGDDFAQDNVFSFFSGPASAHIVLNTAFSSENPGDAWDVRSVGGMGGRFSNERFEELFDAFEAETDPARIRELLVLWDELFNTYVPAIPTSWGMHLSAVNTRVTGLFDEPTDEMSGAVFRGGMDFSRVGLTSH